MALEYKLRENGGETLYCDSCDSPAPTAEFDWGPPFTAKHGKPHRLLCEFCSTTMTSRYTEHPPGDEYGLIRAEVWRANAALFNALKFGFPDGVDVPAVADATKRPLPGALVIQALRVMDIEARKRGEMFPQTNEEQREDTAAVRRVIQMLEFYTSERQSRDGWPTVKHWPALPDGVMALDESKGGT